jgi:hypothetical protein
MRHAFLLKFAQCRNCQSPWHVRLKAGMYLCAGFAVLGIPPRDWRLPPLDYNLNFG